MTFNVKLNFKLGINGDVVTPNNARNNFIIILLIFWYHKLFNTNNDRNRGLSELGYTDSNSTPIHDTYPSFVVTATCTCMTCDIRLDQ